MNEFILFFASIYFVFFIIFLLYQFDVIRIRSKNVIIWCRILNVLETIILVTTRFIVLDPLSKFGLGAFYVLNSILLILQFIYGEFGAGRKILDFFWIGFYVLLFLSDICNISIVQMIQFLQNNESIVALSNFLENSVFGKILVAIFIPVIRSLIIEAIKDE